MIEDFPLLRARFVGMRKPGVDPVGDLPRVDNVAFDFVRSPPVDASPELLAERDHLLSLAAGDLSVLRDFVADLVRRRPVRPRPSTGSSDRSAVSGTSHPDEMPSLLTVAEISTAESDTVAPVVEHLLLRGCVTILGALPKAGKSTLLYGLLGAMERGERFGGLATVQATAIVLSEEPRRTIAQKCARFGVERARFWSRRELARCVDFSAAIAHLVTEAHRLKIGVLVVDTLSAWWKLRPDGEKDEGTIRQAMQPLLDAAASGLCVLGIHHLRKMPGAEGTQLRGSGALHATCDVLAEMRRLDGDTRSTVRVLSLTSRVADAPDEIAFDLRGDVYEPAGSAEDARRGEVRGRILNVLGNDWMTRDEVLDAVGGKSGAASKALRALADEHAIDREGEGKSGNPYRFRARRERTTASDEDKTTAGPSVPPIGRERRNGPVEGSFPDVGSGRERRERTHCAGDLAEDEQ